jgi:hypothetical protein
MSSDRLREISTIQPQEQEVGRGVDFRIPKQGTELISIVYIRVAVQKARACRDQQNPMITSTKHHGELSFRQ